MCLTKIWELIIEENVSQKRKHIRESDKIIYDAVIIVNVSSSFYKESRRCVETFFNFLELYFRGQVPIK